MIAELWGVSGLIAASIIFAITSILMRRREKRDHYFHRAGLCETPPDQIPKQRPKRLLFQRRLESGDLLKADPLHFAAVAGRETSERFWSAFEIPPKYHVSLSLTLKFLAFLIAALMLSWAFWTMTSGVITINHKVIIFSLSLAFAILLPEWGMRRYLQKRQAEIEAKVPDVLNLLTLSVEVGLSFDQAVLEISDLIKESAPRLSAEFKILSRELLILPERETAFDNLIARTGAEGFKSLKLSLMQGEVYGTPIAQSLRRVGLETRQEMLNKREEAARRLPVFLSLPLMLLILPPVIVLSTGPGFISLMAAIGGG